MQLRVFCFFEYFHFVAENFFVLIWKYYKCLPIEKHTENCYFTTHDKENGTGKSKGMKRTVYIVVELAAFKMRDRENKVKTTAKTEKKNNILLHSLCRRINQNRAPKHTSLNWKIFAFTTWTAWNNSRAECGIRGVWKSNLRSWLFGVVFWFHHWFETTPFKT